MARASSRFMKKVPPSGGPPAFKLTLPHQIVHRHLLHLVDADFDLAPSPTAQQTWQGSISPRRNKERSEYTLQGWKLFAEAHQVKAGDQISFELVAPHRMVVQVMSTVSTPDVLPSPAKTMKLAENSSPARSCEYKPDYKQESCEQLLQEPDLLYSSQGLLTEDTMAPYEAWPFMSPDRPSTASEEGSSEISGRRLKSLSAQMDEASIMQKHEGLPPQSPVLVNTPPKQCFSNAPVVPSPNTRSSLAASDELLSTAPLGSSASTFFQDYLTDPLHDPAAGNLEPLTMPKDFFETEETDNSGGASPLNGSSQLDMHLGTLNTTTAKLHADVHRFESRANEAEKEVSNIRSYYNRLQETLDRQTRGALRAATNLEKTTSQLAAPQLLSTVGSQSQEALLTVHSDLLTCLSALKGSLWQLLILSVDEWDTATPP